MIDQSLDPIALLHLLNSPDSNSELGYDQSLSQTDSSGANGVPAPLPVGQFGGGMNSTPQMPISNFAPSIVAQQHLQDLMDSQPQYQKPNLFTKLIGSAIGLGNGPDAAMRYLNMPYERAEEQWKNQVGVAENAARDENQTNSINRQLAFNQATQEANARKQTEVERANKAKEDEQQQKLDIANSRAKAYVFKSMHPDWKPQIGADGILTYFNPQDPTQSVNTGFDTGKMDDYDKINLGIQGREAVAHITQEGENARAASHPSTTSQGTIVQDPQTGKTYRIKPDNTVEPIELPTGVTKLGTPTKPQVPTTTETTTTAPKTFLGFDTGGTKVTKQTTTVKTPGTAPTGKTVHMQSPDGKTYSVDEKDVQESIKHGWKVVGG